MARGMAEERAHGATQTSQSSRLEYHQKAFSHSGHVTEGCYKKKIALGNMIYSRDFQISLRSFVLNKGGSCYNIGRAAAAPLNNCHHIRFRRRQPRSRVHTH